MRGGPLPTLPPVVALRRRHRLAPVLGNPDPSTSYSLTRKHHAGIVIQDNLVPYPGPSFGTPRLTERFEIALRGQALPATAIEIEHQDGLLRTVSAYLERRL